MDSEGEVRLDLPGAVAELGSTVAERRKLRQHQWAQSIVLVILYSATTLMYVQHGSASDPDVWWHLRTGKWIMDHGALPYTDPFSGFGAGKPWQAYSWLFELLIFQLFTRFGLVGIVSFTAAMIVAITFAVHRVYRRLQSDFTISVLLTVAGIFCLSKMFSPRPWFFSILFFALELDVLLQARRTGKTRQLYWLPVIFILWANVHIQFVVGLLVLAIALGDSLVGYWRNDAEVRLRPIRMGCIFVACILATMVNPYGWSLYKLIHDLGAQHGVFDRVSELMAMPFRDPVDFIVLFLAMGAAAALARAKRLPLFEIVLLAFAASLAFRSRRDMWVIVIVASSILAARLPGRAGNSFKVPTVAVPFVLLATYLVVFAAFRMHLVSEQALADRQVKELPVEAVEFVNRKGLSGPLFNDYNWGGYLIWATDLQVSMDGRVNIYWDDQINRSMGTWGGNSKWASDPDLLKARLVIGPVDAPLTQLLRLSPGFELAYEDKIAAVFVARKGSTAKLGDTATGPNSLCLPAR